jgi:DNA polymerase sigma
MKRGRAAGPHERAERRFNPFERDPLAAARHANATDKPPWHDGSATLTDEICALARYVSLSQSEERSREQLVERVRTVTKTLWPSSSIVIFGSWAAGLSTFDSDVDLCVQGCGSGDVEALRQLGGRLQAAPWCRTLSVISGAKVPIITLTDESGISADICLGSSGGDGPRATAFLQDCVRRIRSFAPVVLCLKVHLEQHALTKTFTGGVSSQALRHGAEAHRAEGRPSRLAMQAQPSRRAPRIRIRRGGGCPAGGRAAAACPAAMRS